MIEPSFYSKDLESGYDFQSSFNNACDSLAKWYAQMVEKELVKRIEIIEGRVPNNDEVSKYGRRIIYENDKEFIHYTWKDALLLSVTTPRFEDGKLVVKFANPSLHD